MIRFAAPAAVAVLAIAGASLAQPQATPPPGSGHAETHQMANVARHHLVLLNGVPKPYGAMRDPTPDSLAKRRQGAKIFASKCASCHGMTGQGDGPDGFMLVPNPADLSWLANAPRGLGDPYLYWAIAEGGDPFGSNMPAFKAALSPDEIWAVIAHVRGGLAPIR